MEGCTDADGTLQVHQIESRRPQVVPPHPKFTTVDRARPRHYSGDTLAAHVSIPNVVQKVKARVLALFHSHPTLSKTVDQQLAEAEHAGHNILELNGEPLLKPHEDPFYKPLVCSSGTGEGRGRVKHQMQPIDQSCI